MQSPEFTQTEVLLSYVQVMSCIDFGSQNLSDSVGSKDGDTLIGTPKGSVNGLRPQSIDKTHLR